MSLSSLVRGVLFVLSTMPVFGCVSLETPVSGSRFVIPEVRGSFGKGEIGGGLISTTNIVMVRDADASPEITDKPDLRSGNDVNYFGRLGLLNFLDIHIDSAAGLGGIIQLVGKPSTEATEGSWSLAAQGHVAEFLRKGELDSSSRSYIIKTEARAKHIDYGVIVGLRRSSSLLLYASVIQSRVTASGDVKKINRESGDTKQFIVDPEESLSNIINLGCKFGENDRMFAMLETGYMQTTFPRAENFNRPVAGLNIGFAW
ncbi:MAG: hypothetical protein NT027_05100 [Proteobacteria bacterium]|nr:hypothetical protein [Pseudomonadota bacterium]